MPLVPGPVASPATNGYGHVSDVLALVPISSSAASVRIGDFGPARIINTNLNGATVWVHRDANVRDGLGIPIGPGTSLDWVGGELWAILGTDASSAGQTVQLLVTSYVSNWQPNPIALAIAILNSGTLVVDAPVELVTAAITFNGLTDLGDFAISTFQSLLIKTAKSGAAHTVLLEFLWKLVPGAAAAIIGRDQYRWTTGDVAGMENVVIPCRGAYVQIRYTTVGAGAIDSLQVYASHRPKTALDTIGDGTKLLASATNAALGAGAALNATPTSRYDGPVVICVETGSGGANASPVYVRGLDNITGRNFALQIDPGVVINGFGRAGVTLHGVAPRNSVQYDLINIGAVAVTATLEILAAPEGT